MKLISQPSSDARHLWMNIEEEEVEEVHDAVIEDLREEIHHIVLTLHSGDGEENDGESDELLKVLIPPFSKYCFHFEALESIAYSTGQLGVYQHLVEARMGLINAYRGQRSP